MKQVKILGIVFMLVGVISLFIGAYLSAQREEDDYMENVNINIKMSKCLDNICTSELFIENTKGAGSKMQFKITNKEDTSLPKGEIILKFSTGQEVSYKYEQLASKETIEVKKTLKDNFGYVTDYELKKKN